MVLGHPVYGVRAYVWLEATHMRAFPCPYVHSFKHTSTSLYAAARRGDTRQRVVGGGTRGEAAGG